MNFYLPDRYKVVGKPLRGGMGVVYLCLDRKLQRPVVLKTFRAELLRNLATPSARQYNAASL